MYFYTYIIRSQSSGKIYIGQTADLQRRINEHNAGVTRSTRGRGPWELIFAKPHLTRQEAVQLERRLKSWKNSTKVMEWIGQQK